MGLAAASDASNVVGRARTLTVGTASLGTFKTAHHRLLPALVEDIAHRHPEWSSASSARTLPSSQTPHGPSASKPAWSRFRSTTTASRSAPRRCSSRSSTPAPTRPAQWPTTIEQLSRAVLVLLEARWGNEDPRRQQLAARVQRAGLTIRAHIECNTRTPPWNSSPAASPARSSSAPSSTPSDTATVSPVCHSTTAARGVRVHPTRNARRSPAHAPSLRSPTTTRLAPARG
jgi:hypothetical protein